MKKLVKVQEVEGEGMVGLMGEQITVMCMNYFYTGKLIGINESCILLSDAAVVFDTGAFDSPEWADAQKLGSDWYVQLTSIESFGILK